MASYEPDTDFGIENAWESSIAKAMSSLCQWCEDEQAAPNESLCPDCLAEVIGHNALVDGDHEELT